MFKFPLPLYAGEDGGGGGGGDAAAAAAAAEAAAAEAAAAAAKKGGGGDSLLGAGDGDGDGGGDRGKVDALPENWRDLIAGGNTEYSTELGRYKTPTDMINSLIETKKKVRSGIKSDDPMPGADKPEEQKQWRKDHGIPETPEGYKIAEETAKRLMPDDKVMLDSFIAAAHAAGKSQDYVDFATGWYVEAMEQADQLQADNDKKQKTDAEDLLREEFGPDYRRNINVVIKAVKETIPGVDLTEARLPDGRKLGSVPEFIKGFLEYGLNRWGDGAFIGEETVKATSSRKAEIENIQKTDLSKYTDDLRKEYGEILAAEERAAQRGARTS